MFCNNLVEGTITTSKEQSDDDQLTYNWVKYLTSSPPRGGIPSQKGRYSKMNTKYNGF